MASRTTAKIAHANNTASSGATRRSTRKRKVPLRYGFDETKEAKRRRTSNERRLLDLPTDTLEIVCSYLCTPSDFCALQTTNKLLRILSLSEDMRQSMKLLPTSSDTTSDEDSPTSISSVSIIQNNDTSRALIKRLYPFAIVSNLDALFLLGRIATYVEDDVETGMALWQKGMDRGDLRCQYELANILVRNRRHQPSLTRGQVLIAEAAAAGHGPSQICSTTNAPMGDARKPIYAKAAAEMKSTARLQVLMDQKRAPPRPSWVGSTCSNPLCNRQCYRVRRRRARHWLQTKKCSNYWKVYRPTLLEKCSIPCADYDAETLFCVPDFHVCARCMQADYCGRACQVLHWATHKADCRPPRVVPQGIVPVVAAGQEGQQGN